MCRNGEWAELPQRPYCCPDLPQLKGFVLSFSSGELMRPSEYLILLEFQVFLQPLGLTLFHLSVKYLLLPSLFPSFLAMVQKIVGFGFPFSFRKIFLKRPARAHWYVLLILCHSTDEKPTYAWMKGGVTLGLHWLYANEQQKTGKVNLMLG